MEDKKKQIGWDFSELQESLTRYYGTPEACLLKANEGILSIIQFLDDDTPMRVLKDNLFPINLLLQDISKAVENRTT